MYSNLILYQPEEIVPQKSWHKFFKIMPKPNIFQTMKNTQTPDPTPAPPTPAPEVEPHPAQPEIHKPEIEQPTAPPEIEPDKHTPPDPQKHEINAENDTQIVNGEEDEVFEK